MDKATRPSVVVDKATRPSVVVDKATRPSPLARTLTIFDYQLKIQKTYVADLAKRLEEFTLNLQPSMVVADLAKRLEGFTLNLQSPMVVADLAKRSDRLPKHQRSLSHYSYYREQDEQHVRKSVHMQIKDRQANRDQSFKLRAIRGKTS